MWRSCLPRIRYRQRVIRGIEATGLMASEPALLNRDGVADMTMERVTGIGGIFIKAKSLFNVFSPRR